MKPRYLITSSAFFVGIAATFCLILAQWFVFKKINEPLFFFVYNATTSLSASFLAKSIGNRLAKDNLHKIILFYVSILLGLLAAAILLTPYLPIYIITGFFVLLGCMSYFVKIFDQIVKNVMGKYKVRKYLKFTKLLVAAREASPLIAGLLGYWLFDKSSDASPSLRPVIAVGLCVLVALVLDFLVSKINYEKRLRQKTQSKRNFFKTSKTPKIGISGLPERRILLLSFVPYIANISFAPFIPIYISSILGLGIDKYYASFVVYGIGAVLGTRMAFPYAKHALHHISLLATLNFAAALLLMCFTRSYGLTLVAIFMIALMNASVRTVRGTCLLENVYQSTYAKLTTKLESNALIAVVFLNALLGFTVQFTSITFGFIVLIAFNIGTAIVMLKIPRKMLSKRRPPLSYSEAQQT